MALTCMQTCYTFWKLVSQSLVFGTLMYFVFVLPETVLSRSFHVLYSADDDKKLLNDNSDHAFEAFLARQGRSWEGQRSEQEPGSSSESEEDRLSGKERSKKVSSIASVLQKELSVDKTVDKFYSLKD